MNIDIAAIPGDGIGAEVVPEGIRVLEAAARLHGGIKFSFTYFPWSCQHYVETGRMMPEDGLQTLGNFDGIFLGAVGHPSVPDHVSLWGLLIPIRRGFEQYVNLRPAKLLAGVPSPLRNAEPGTVDFVVIRENTEGEYSNMGGRVHEGTPGAAAVQVNYFSRTGIERVGRYAFNLAAERKGHLTVATKSNGIVHSMPFWDEVVRGLASDYREVQCELTLVDALAAYFVTRPESFDVVLATNLFGDILTDLSAAVVGSIGIAPSANLNPERQYPSMFEPVHGSAPDIAGKGLANPIGQIWTAKMLLDFFGANDVADQLMNAIEATLAAGIRTPDLGGIATTVEVTDKVIQYLLGARQERSS